MTTDTPTAAINLYPTDGRPLVPILVPDKNSTSGQRIVLTAAKEAAMTTPTDTDHRAAGIEKAVRAGCTAADIHLMCSYPTCGCKATPKIATAALAAWEAHIAETQKSPGD